MSGDSHRRREDPEREPLTKGRSYNPHIVLLQAPTHPSSSLDPSQRLYFPIDSPPTPAPSPRPQLPYTGLPPPLPSRVQAESMSISNQLLTNFTTSHSPQTRRQILTALLQACTPNELLFLSQTIAPLLKRDFLFSLPPELGLHVLGFIDDPKTLIRASLVSKWWYRMIRDESVWRRMCLIHGFGEGDGEERERDRSKHHQHRHKEKYSMGNLNDASRGEQPFSALLREDAANSDGREGLSGLSSPPTDSSSSRPREVSKNFSYRRHFKMRYIIRLNWRHGGKLLNSQIVTPVLPPSRPLIAPSEANPDDALPSTVTSFALDKSWLVVGLANSSIKVFSAHSGVLARTLVGHESGVWGVCLVEKGGWREGGEPVKEEVGGSSNERREMKVRKKQKERQEKEDRETTPRPATAKESATVTLVIDPDSKKPRRRRDTGKDKNGEKDGEKEERKSRRPTPPNEIPIIGHVRVEANDRIRDEPSRGSSSSSHHEGLPGPSSATTATPASAGPSRTRRASPSPTTPKRPRKYPSTIPQHRVDNEFHDLSILQPVESGLAGETFPILSAGVNGSSAPTPTTAAIKDESDEAHSRHRHDTHHHHHHQQHQRRSRRNSAVNQGGPTHARNNDSANKRAEHVELNAHPPQRGSIPKGDGMHVMPGESLAHLLPAALRVALGLRAVPGGVSGDASEGSSDSEGEWGGQGRYRRRRGDSQRREEENVAVDLSGDGGERRPLGYDAKAADGNMTNASRGWGQPNALVVSGGCDKVLRVWEVKSGQCIYVLHGHTATIRAIRVLPNRPIAITGSRDSTLRIWDVQLGVCLRVLEGHASSVRCLDVSGNKVVSGSYDATCRVWDVDTGECLHVLRGHFHQIYSVAFDGVRIASGGLDTTVRVWDAESGQCIALLQGHAALVCQLQLSQHLLVTGGSDGRVITFSLSTFQPLHRIAAHDSSVTSLQFDASSSFASSPSSSGDGDTTSDGAREGQFLVTAGNDGRVKLWELATGRWIRDLSDVSTSVWKVGCVWGSGCVAVMCRREGKTVVEVWSMRPRGRGKERDLKEGGKERGKEVR